MAVLFYCPVCKKTTLHGGLSLECSECKSKEEDRRFEEFKKMSLEERTEYLYREIENIKKMGLPNPVLG